GGWPRSLAVGDRGVGLGYTYYADGKVESITSSNANGASVTYAYDDLNRLSTVVDNNLTGQNTTGDPANNNGDNGSATYTLDPVGNRTAAASTLSGINPIAGTYNANDQISSETYDANGNVTHTGSMSYTY